MGKDLKGKEIGKGFSQRKDGRYCYRLTKDGKSACIYDTNLDRLKAAAKRAEKAIESGKYIDGSNKMTLNDCFEIYLNMKRPDIEDTTYDNYVFLYDRYIRDGIGSRRIASIKYDEMVSLYKRLLRDHLQIGSLKIIHNILNPTFRYALKNKIVDENILLDIWDDVKVSKDKKPKKKVAMTEREQREFMNYARNSAVYSEYVPLFTILFGTGLRIGECLALTWDDVDLKREIISVNKTLVYRGQKSDKRGAGRFQINSTKTEAGEREIPMLSEVKKAFLELKKRRLTNGICETIIGEYGDFVFCNSNNHVYKATAINRAITGVINAYNKSEAKIAEEEKREAFQIRHFSAHGFRHTFATNYCQHETNLKTIQEIMGHADISITMKVYADATEESKRESFKNLEGKFMIG